MTLRPMLSPRRAPPIAWPLARPLALLVLLALFALAACTSDDQQSDAQQAQPQQQAAQPQAQPDPAAQPDQADQTDQQQSQQPQPDAEQQAQDAEPSAQQTMSRAQQQQTQQQTQGYGPSDAYAAAQQDAQDEPPATPVPPVRKWLVEGVSLTPSVPALRDEYGWSAVIEGDVIAVGAPYHDVMGDDSGAVFIFERIGDQWLETAYILPPFPDPHGWFGRWLAIDAGRIVIGAPYEDGRAADGGLIPDSGAAYVYEKVDGEWTRTGTLLPKTPRAGASFGWSVAISGERIAVSAWVDPAGGLRVGSVTTFTQHKGLWQPEAVMQPNEPSERLMFGRDIDLQGGILVIGAPGDDTIAKDAGAVYVWHYYSNAWHFAGRLVAADGIAGDMLGSQVALQRPWIASGAYDHDDPYWSAGATYVWKLDALWNFHAKLEASDQQPGDWFGYSVDIKDDRMVIGAPHRAHPETGVYRSGAAYVFELTQDQWVEVGVLGPVNAIEAGERAEFGWVAEIDETTAVVGAWLADTAVGGEDAGAAAVYEIPTETEGDDE